MSDVLDADAVEQFKIWAADFGRWDTLPTPARPEVIVRHARDIPDTAMLGLISQLSRTAYSPWGQRDSAHWVSQWDLAGALRLAGFRADHGANEMPAALVLAKAERLVDRGLLSGCVCGCRGDFELTDPADETEGAQP